MSERKKGKGQELPKTSADYVAQYAIQHLAEVLPRTGENRRFYAVRKGQFFIIAAVAIILILITLNTNVNQSFLFDTSTSQADRTAWIILELMRQTNLTVFSSSGASDAVLQERLSALNLAWQRTLILENIKLNTQFVLSPTSVAAAYELRTESATLFKNVTLPRV